MIKPSLALVALMFGCDNMFPLHDSNNGLVIAIYPEILGVEFCTLCYLRVLRVGILAANDAALF